MTSRIVRRRAVAQATAMALIVPWAAPPAGAQSRPAPSLAAVEVTDSAVAPGSTLGLDVAGTTGSRLGLAPRETPASISRLDRQDIAERGLARAQDVAIRTPGLTESPSPGNGGTSLVARGFAGHGSVAQMVDGTRLVAAAGTITYPFSTWPLESVEVLRGPASVLYGDGAIGAAVNYITRQPLFERSEREAFVGLGSFGTRRGGIGLRGPIGEILAYSIFLDASRSDGYRRFEDHDRRNQSIALAARPTRDLQVTVSLDGGRNDDARYFGTPLRDGVLDPRLRRTNFNVEDSVVRYDDRMWRARVQYQAGDGVRLRNETYHLTTGRHWRNAEAATFDATGTRVARSDYLEILHDQTQDGNRFDATLDGAVAGLRHRLVLGVDAYRTRLLHTNNAPYGGASSVDPFDFAPGSFVSPETTRPGRRATLATTALFAENALDLSPRWKLVGGLRHDRMDFDNDDLRQGLVLGKSYSPTTGRVGAIWTPREALSLYGQYSTATDPLSGALSLPNGSTAFDLTRGRQLEAGAKGALPAVRGEWTLAVYRIEKHNLLSRDPVDPTRVQQVGRQSSTGAELAVAAEPVRGWTIDANAALLRARYDDFNEVVGGTLVPRAGNVPVDVPQRMANLWTAYRFQPRWQAGLGLRHVGVRQSDAANTASLPAYTLVDATLAYAPHPGLTFTLAVRNLTDRDYAVSGTGNVRWLLGAPRTVELMARAMF